VSIHVYVCVGTLEHAPYFSSHKIKESSDYFYYAPFVHLIKWMLHHEPDQRPDVRQVLMYLETMEEVVSDKIPNLSKDPYDLLPIMPSKEVGQRCRRSFSFPRY
jgi:hypothetical protein